MHLLSLTPRETPERSVSRSPATHLPDRQRPLPRMARLTFSAQPTHRCSRNHSTQLDQSPGSCLGAPGGGAGEMELGGIRKWPSTMRAEGLWGAAEGSQRVEGLCAAEGGREPWWGLDKSQDLSSRLSEPKPLLAYSARRQTLVLRLPGGDSSVYVICPWRPVPQTLSQPLLHHPILCWAVRGTRYAPQHSGPSPALPRLSRFEETDLLP